MKIGLFAINYGTCGDPAVAVRVAQAAEAAGFESVWTGEHIVLPDPMLAEFPMPPETPLLDTIVALTWIAAYTKRLRIGTGIVLLPPRNPVILAKELASVDVVSGGRLIVGVGAGWLEAEFKALGSSMAERGKRMDHAIAAMRALWTMQHPEYYGPTVSFNNVNSYPRPAQHPAPPIIVAGHSHAALQRAVTMGNGWYGFALTLDETRRHIDELNKICEQQPRPSQLGKLEISVTPIGPFDRSTRDAYADAGVDRLIMLPKYDASPAQRHDPVPAEEILRNIERLNKIAELV